MAPDHESMLRRMIAGGSYQAYPSLADAKAAAEAAVVMQGDDGGSIYLTCPARAVECDEAGLRRLLLDLDAHMWNDPEMAGHYYERAPVGTGIAGGTGGGVVIDGVWLHPELEAKNLRTAVEGVIAGHRKSIGS